jgi:hypothetical protein
VADGELEGRPESQAPSAVHRLDGHRGSVGQGRTLGGGVDPRRTGAGRGRRTRHRHEGQPPQPIGEDLVVLGTSRVIQAGQEAVPEGPGQLVCLLDVGGHHDHEIMGRYDQAVLAESAVTVVAVT